WRSGRLERTERAETFAEGLATRVAFEPSLRLLMGVVDDVVLVDDDAIERAMVDLLRHAHLLAEGAGAASTAAVSRPDLRERLVGKKVALMVSGANLTPEVLRGVLERQVAG